MKHKVVYITGYKGSGKTSCARFMINRIREVHTQWDPCMLPFVSVVKKEAARLFDLDERLFNDPATKDVQLGSWPFMSPRNILLGVADSLLNRWPEIWVRKWERQVHAHLTNVVLDKPSVIFVPDLRMHAEYNAYHKLRYHNRVDSVIIRIKRAGQSRPGLNAHITEKFIDDWREDYLIHNDHGLEHFEQTCSELADELFGKRTATGEMLCK